MPVATVEFELRYRKEARKKLGRAKMTRDEVRYAKLPGVPPQFAVTTGGYKHVAKTAANLNEIQLRSGFLDYLFFPEVTTAPRGTEKLERDDA